MKKSNLMLAGAFISAPIGAIIVVIGFMELASGREMFEGVCYLLIGIACCGAAGSAYWFAVPSAEFEERLDAIKPLKGRSRKECVRALGRPNETEVDGDDELLTWKSPKRSVTLRFESGTCVGAVREKDL